MKKFGYSFLFLFLLAFAGSTFAQLNFSTGKAYIRVDNYGAVRYFTHEGSDTIQHINRASVLFGGNANQVMDYYEDLEIETPIELVGTPLKSDYEIKASYNNTYSNKPPNFLIQENVYGWNNMAFTIIKFTATNKEAAAVPCIPGLDIIQYVDEDWANNTIYFDAQNKMLVQYKTRWIGIKALSEDVKAGRFIEWFENYYTDSLYYVNMQPGFRTDTLFTDDDGGIGILAAASSTLQPNASKSIYWVIVSGSTKTEMLSNLALAVQKYSTFTSVESNTNITPKEFGLNQNYPNPFNPSTTISFNLPLRSQVTLKVYDLLGKEVAQLVNEELEAGVHSTVFNASSLPSGTYYYTLTANGKSFSNKMMLVK